jgi:hypothetical protein
MFCRKGATLSISSRRKLLTDKKINRAGDGLHPNGYSSAWIAPPGRHAVERFSHS